MTDHCEYCQKPLAKSRRKRRFCPAPAGCRQAWHREHTSPGIVTGLRQLPSGKWSITIRYPDQPDLQMGSRVLVEKADISRPEPSSGDQPGAPIQGYQEQESGPSPAFPVYLK